MNILIKHITNTGMHMVEESEKLLICFIWFYSVAAVFMTTSVQSGKMTFSDKTSNKTAARS